MKRITLLSFLILLVGVSFFEACTKSPKSNWINVFRLPIGGSGSGHEIVRLQCKSASIGYAVTPVGFIRTTQGGRLWSDGAKLPSSSSYDMMDFDFYNEKSGVSIASNGTSTQVFSTVDGGAFIWTLRASSLTSVVLSGRIGRKLFMKDATNGIIITANIEFLSTADGGTTWKYEGKLVTAQNYVPLITITGNTITALEKGGKVSQSSDNGKTWLFKTTIPGGSTSSGIPFSIQSIDGKVMYATLRHALYKSTNAGTTWLKINPESGILCYTARMYDGNIVSIVGIDENNNIVVWTSSDDAASWNKEIVSKVASGDIHFDMIANAGLVVADNQVFSYAK